MKKTILIIFSILIVITMFIAGYGLIDNGNKLNYDEFAQCLTEKSAVMYGVYWCHYCNLQKKEFGDSFQFINYVECSEEKDECTEKGIQSFPTWIINDVKYKGKQSLSRLSALTECKLPKEV